MILEQCKGVHCVDLGESFPTHIYLQNFVSIQPRTGPVKFACSSCTDPPGPAPALAHLGGGAAGACGGIDLWLITQKRLTGKLL